MKHQAIEVNNLYFKIRSVCLCHGLSEH